LAPIVHKGRRLASRGPRGLETRSIIDSWHTLDQTAEPAAMMGPLNTRCSSSCPGRPYSSDLVSPATAASAYSSSRLLEQPRDHPGARCSTGSRTTTGRSSTLASFTAAPEQARTQLGMGVRRVGRRWHLAAMNDGEAAAGDDLTESLP
jgi:hypothetical protein